MKDDASLKGTVADGMERSGLALSMMVNAAWKTKCVRLIRACCRQTELTWLSVASR